MSDPNAVWPDGTRWAVGQAHDQWMKRSQFDPTSVATDILTALEPFVQQRIAAVQVALVGALEELECWPDLARTRFVVRHEDKTYEVPPTDLEGVFEALSRHASTMYPWAVETMRLANHARVLQPEVDALRAEVARLREDGERWQYARNNGTWRRGDDPHDGAYTEWAIRVAPGANLSCAVMVDHAIDAARSARGGEG